MTRRVFVAGATGVLGRRVVPALVAAGHDVTANVRDDAAARWARDAAAATTTVDLFDRAATERVGEDHDVVVNIATSIPTGVSAARRSSWAMNDRLRREASRHLASAMSRDGARYIGESTTFQYVDAGAEWITESHDRTYFWGNESCRDAEQSAAGLAASGGDGVLLRFAMFYADDSAHALSIRAAASKGLFALPGRPDSHITWVHVDDAAAAVVSALEAPSGVYNVTEPDPTTRGNHADALARAAGRRRLRSIPGLSQLGGKSVESLTRSQRVSSKRLSEATGWRAERAVVDAW